MFNLAQRGDSGKWFSLDTEFIENGVTIDLVSIGLVCGDGREYYAISSEYDATQASDWVRWNVLESLNAQTSTEPTPATIPKSRSRIKSEIIDFCGESPQFWGDYCSYDWVVFCQLFGKMIDLPSTYPMRIRDIIQLCKDQMGLQSRQLLDSLETPGHHHALLGARSVKDNYDLLMSLNSDEIAWLVANPLVPIQSREFHDFKAQNRSTKLANSFLD